MKKIIKITLLIPAILLLISCNRNSGLKEKEPEVLAANAIELNAAQFKTAGIVLGTLQDRSIRSVLKVNGTINVIPQNVASVSAPLGGFIKSTGIVQGSSVRKGEPLAMVENMAFIELQQNYLETKARYGFAEIEFRRHTELYKDNVYSEKNVQQTEMEFKTLKSQLKGLEQKLLILGIDPRGLTEDKITGVVPVLAPISGFIRTVNVNVGKYVNPTDVMFEIVNQENIILELIVFEKDVQLISNGQKVSFNTPNDPGKLYTATIYQAGKMLDKDKTSKVYATIANPDGKLLSGMYVNAGVEINSQKAVAINQEAVVQFNSLFYIFTFKGKRMENGKVIYDFEAIEVKKGNTDQGFTEIFLPEGIVVTTTQVVTTGAYAILSAWKNAGEMAC